MAEHPVLREIGKSSIGEVVGMSLILLRYALALGDNELSVFARRVFVVVETTIFEGVNTKVTGTVSRVRQSGVKEPRRDIQMFTNVHPVCSP